MVVRYEEVQAELFCVQRLLHGSYATVHSNNKARTARADRVKRRAVETVTLFEPVRYVWYALQSLLTQVTRHEAGRGYTVHVVVAVHGYGLMPFYSLAHTRGGLGHICHGLGGQ